MISRFLQVCTDLKTASLLYYPVSSTTNELENITQLCPLFGLVLSMVNIAPEQRITFDEFNSTLSTINVPPMVITESALIEMGVNMSCISMTLCDTADMEQLVNMDIRGQNVKKG